MDVDLIVDVDEDLIISSAIIVYDYYALSVLILLM
jgi:hypothetical protein